jgi:hypothetical protein
MPEYRLWRTSRESIKNRRTVLLCSAIVLAAAGILAWLQLAARAVDDDHRKASNQHDVHRSPQHDDGARLRQHFDNPDEVMP